MLLTNFHRLLNELPEPGGSQPSVSPIPRAPRRLRIARVATASGTEPGEYLPWSEVRLNWEAASFLSQHYGSLLNLRCTIRPAEMGIQDHVAGAKLLSGLTHELGQRLDEWCPDAKQFHWIYRHEADQDGYLLTRLMMSIPAEHLAAAVQWMRCRFFTRERCPALSSMVLRNSQNFHWSCVRALSRSLDPALCGRSEEGARRPLVDLLRIPRRWRGPTGLVHCVKKRGASESIRRPAQMAAAEGMPFLSALDDCAWQWLDQGWELREHRDWLAEGLRRQEQEGRVRGLFAADDELTRARCAEEIARLRASYPLNPKERLRSWIGWWGPELGSVPASRRRSLRR